MTNDPNFRAFGKMRRGAVLFIAAYAVVVLTLMGGAIWVATLIVRALLKYLAT